MPVLSSFLRRNQRALKLSTLLLLDTMVKNYSTSLALDTLSPVLAELPPLVSETDLHIAQLTLNLITSIFVSHSQAIPTIQKTVLPEVLKLNEPPVARSSSHSNAGLLQVCCISWSAWLGPLRPTGLAGQPCPRG